MVDRCYNLNNFVRHKEKILNGDIECIHGNRSKNLFLRSVIYKVISLTNWLLISLLFEFKIKDYQNTYFIKSKLVKKIKIYSKNSFCNAELILKFINQILKF